MKLSRLKIASYYDVEKWLEKSLELTPYQKQKLHNEEIVRFSRFYFYEHKKENKVSVLWRLTIFFYLVYIILLVCFLPIKWLFTGKWGYGDSFLYKFHYKWVHKLNL